MSEYVFGYILALERSLFEMRDDQRRRIWREMPYRSLQGRRLGICGTGDIGRHLAKTARHFGMEVWGYRRRTAPCPAFDRTFSPDAFREFLAGPDYMVIALPLTPDTRRLFDRQALSAMKETAVLINVGRGSIVSEQDLARAVQRGRIRGAVLDVFETEPLPEESPLWTLPGVFVTPHNAAFSFAEDIIAIFLENYQRFRRGASLRHVVDPGRGY
jgi:phosphoglycerate dehydrogenase-like enzyme